MGLTLTGKVKFVFDFSLLRERNDYYLNTCWYYGKVESTLVAKDLD